MSTTQLLWNEARQTPGALRRSLRHHRKVHAQLGDLVLVSQWRPGISAGGTQPVMISLTQFTPLHSRDLPNIWLAGIRLADQLTRLDGAVGVATYLRPGRHRELGSLSVWTDGNGLESFMTLPDHVEIMNKYRTRGLPVRSATWHTPEPEIDVEEAVTIGLRLLDSHEERRIVLSDQ